MWPHDVESVQGSTFCLFAMVQPWNIGVCWIDQVFATELTVVIFFVHATVLSIKTAFNLVTIHLVFRIIPLIQWGVMFFVHVLILFGDWNIYPVCFPNICWHSGLKNQWKYVQQTKFVILVIIISQSQLLVVSLIFDNCQLFYVVISAYNQ